MYTKGEIIQVIMIASPPMQRILEICFLICIFKNKMNNSQQLWLLILLNNLLKHSY